MRRFISVVVLVLAGSVLAFGAVYPWAYWPLTAVCAVLGIWAIRATRRSPEPAARTANKLLALVAIAIAAQLVPLPTAVFARLAPAADRFLASYDLRYVLQPPAWHTLSIAPGSTLTVLLIFVSFGLFFVGLMKAVAHVRLQRLVLPIMWLGVALAVFGVLQRAVNAKSPDNDEWQLVYGFWKPEQAGNVFGPFVNRNHYAGWMVMALSLVMGYCFAVIEQAAPSARHDWRRWLRWTATPDASHFLAVAIAVLAMGGALLATGSRSGAISFAAAIAALGYFVAMRLGRRPARVVAIGGLVLLFGGAVAAAGASRTAARFSLASSDLGMRVRAWHDTTAIMRDFPIFGVGAGAYRFAVLHYQTGDRTKFYAQAHNDYLQVAAEGGVLVGLPVLVAIIALVQGIRTRVAKGDTETSIYWIRAGAIAGLVGIAAQSLVDFSLQMPANLALFVVLAAIALHRPLRSAPHARRV